MRGNELLAALQAAKVSACARLLQGLQEKDRRVLHAVVDRFLRELGDEQWEQLRAGRLAMLGTASLGELKKAGMWTYVEPQALEILADRCPDWLAEWANMELQRNFRNWKLVRALIRRGLIARPAAESYVLGMIIGVAPPLKGLAEDPELLDEVWQLFEVEGTSELSLAAHDRREPPAHTWLEAMRSLAEAGKLDRGRLLNASLEALQRDFAPFRAGWFSRLHEALQPTDAERCELCDRYLDLLASRVPATVSFAMKAITRIHKAGSLDVAIVADRLAPALEARDKGTVQRALALLSKARNSAVAARALVHESPEIQAAALAVVGNDAALIAPYAETLAPSVRARLGVAGSSAQSEAAAIVAAVNPVVPIDRAEELVETFAAVLENQGPPIEIERVLDGVARMSAASLGRLTAPLASRADKLLARSDLPQQRFALAGLALAWIRGERMVELGHDHSLAGFLFWRLWCLAEQVAQGIEQPLLSLPSWPDGRIEPAEFERRLAELSGSRRNAAEADLLLARLRAYGSDSVRDAKYKIVWQTRSWEAQGQTYFHHEPRVQNIGSLSRPSRLDPARLTVQRFEETLEMKRWCATVCPRWREGWFAAGCRELGDNMEWYSANWSTRAYLEPLLETHTDPGEMGALLIALALSAKEQGQAGLAVDALAAAKLTGEQLGPALIEASASGAIKLSRWAKQMQRAARAGTKPARAIAEALELFFASGSGAESVDFGRLVELQLELAHQTGLRITRPAARRTLEGLASGSSKAARAAKALLHL